MNRTLTEKLKLLFSPPAGQVPVRIFRILVQRVRRRFLPTPQHWPTEAELSFMTTGAPENILFDKNAPALVRGALDEKNVTGFFERFPDARSRLFARAYDVLENRFDLLGSGRTDLGAPIDWHRDFKSGVCWDPVADCLTVRETASGSGGDIKVPWELSRFHFLLWLGQAYRLTGDEIYADKGVQLLLSWIDANPPGKGANWNCTMDVAIRTLNWLAGLELLAGSNALTIPVQRRLVGALAVHGIHIRVNLENPGSNHSFADLVGLLALGARLPGLARADSWKRRAMKGLVNEMRLDVQPDGTVHEASTGYHALMTEMALVAFYLAKQSGESFPDSIQKKIGDMVRAVEALTKPSGRLAQIGDYDSGRILPFGGDSGLDPGHLLWFGAALGLHQPAATPSPQSGVDALWLTGDLPDQNFDSTEKERFAFADSGWYLFKGNGLYLLVSCGPVGLFGTGSHSHNDKLSFELSLAGQDLIVDPGAYIYTPDPKARDRFRSTACHNTVMVDGQEQNRSDPSTRFSMFDDTRARCVKWEQDGESVKFIGRHRGYQRLRPPVTHERSIRLDLSGRLQIEDRLEGSGERVVRRNFTLAPSARAETVGEGKVSITAGPVRAHFRFEPDAEARIVDSEVSAEYGVKQPTQAIEIVQRLALPARLESTLNWTLAKTQN